MVRQRLCFLNGLHLALKECVGSWKAKIMAKFFTRQTNFRMH